MASESHCQLFGLPLRFTLDDNALEHTWRALAALIDEQQGFERASGKIREWMFVEKLSREVQGSLNDLNPFLSQP